MKSRITRLLGTVGAAFAVSAAALALPEPAQAETLRVGHLFPANHYIQTQLIDVFTKAVEESSGGDISFELFPAAQLGKDMVRTQNSGILDIATVVTGRQAELFPLTAVGELPLAAKTACEGSERMWQMTKPGGILDELEFAPNKVRVLAASMLAPYVLFTRNKAIRSPADVAGLKVWASGPAASEVISAIGAVPIILPSTELYDSASRGTVDGAVFPYSGLIQYNLQPVLNNAMEGVHLGSAIFFLTISTSAWEKLSAEQQENIAEAGQEAQDAFCAYLDTSNAEQQAQVAALDGYTVVQLEEPGRSEFSTRLEGVSTSWAAKLDGIGRKGSQVLKAYRATSAE